MSALFQIFTCARRPRLFPSLLPGRPPSGGVEIEGLVVEVGVVVPLLPPPRQTELFPALFW